MYGSSPLSPLAARAASGAARMAERGQIHPSRPALGALDHCAHGVVGAVHTGVGEDGPGLLLGERQILHTELDRTVLAAKAAEAQHQPGPDHEVEARRQTRGQRPDEVHRRDVAQLVDVVEHQHTRPVPGPQGRQEVGERRQVTRSVPDRESPEHRRVQRLDAVQRQSDVPGQTDRIPVGLDRPSPRRTAGSPPPPTGSARSSCRIRPAPSAGSARRARVSRRERPAAYCARPAHPGAPVAGSLPRQQRRAALRARCRPCHPSSGRAAARNTAASYIGSTLPPRPNRCAL